MRKWLIIDTDAGVDDAVAIVLALKLANAHDFDIKALTTTYGNCDVEQVTKNVSKTRAACGFDYKTGPRIVKGCSYPLLGPESRIDATYFHGMDGLGNNEFSDESIDGPDEYSDFYLEKNKKRKVEHDERNAARELIKLVAEGKSKNIKVSVVVLGPMTNLAHAMKINDRFHMDIDSLVIMGGCGNARGNITRTAEFNFAADPEAASFVLNMLEQKNINDGIKHNINTTVVSWELTLAHYLPWTLFDKYISDTFAKRSRSNDFLYQICKTIYSKENRHLPIDNFDETVGNSSQTQHEHEHGAIICDALCVAIALNPALITCSRNVNVEIELDGKLTRGQSVVDWGCYDAVDRVKNVKWINSIDSDLYAEMFSRMFD